MQFFSYLTIIVSPLSRHSYQQGFISSWECNKCTGRWKKAERRWPCAISR